ncbi:MAG: Gfo/Idh/MocA family oxidoreductase [Candidatus Poribacteria bacterium]|nr:Gfo/Idh/MocA family oxidoreductase [Candidatus Poribacteria bacterium]
MSESTNISPKYRVAIVGCGGISRAHGNAWRNVPEIEIVGACDEKFESLANFATEYNVQNTYNDLRQMLEKQQPDVLVVATWPSSHLKNVLEAVRCGVKGILVEKPIAVNTTQLEQMIQVTERSNILLMEAFMYRHHPLTLAVKQKIEEGAIGEVRYARSSFSTGLTDRQNWRLRGDLGGGAVMDLGCYSINIMRYLVGREPQSVWATGKFEAINHVWETLIGTLDFGDGVTGQLDCSFGWTWRECYEVAGTDGTLFVESAWGNSEGEAHFTVDGETFSVSGVNPYAAEILDLCRAVETGTPTRLPITDALGNMRTIDALHESAHTGQRIAVSQ